MSNVIHYLIYCGALFLTFAVLLLGVYCIFKVIEEDIKVIKEERKQTE